MRHGVKLNHLGRKAPHRKAMMSNMGSSLIKHKKITTTLAKAKALRVFIEPLITKSKNDTTHNRRTVFAYLKDKEAVTELFGPVSEKIADRPGGYTRIFKLGNRMGDNADMALIELVDFNEYFQKDSKSASKKTTRRGRSRKPAPVVASTDTYAIEKDVKDTVQKTEVEDVAVEDVAVEDVAVEDVAVEDVAVEDVAVEDVAVEDVAVLETETPEIETIAAEETDEGAITNDQVVSEEETTAEESNDTPEEENNNSEEEEKKD
jgi:large subunit ribosomal protein L17